jgi:hypothetical protein
MLVLLEVTSILPLIPVAWFCLALVDDVYERGLEWIGSLIVDVVALYCVRQYSLLEWLRIRQEITINYTNLFPVGHFDLLVQRSIANGSIGSSAQWLLSW